MPGMRRQFKAVSNKRRDPKSGRPLPRPKPGNMRPGPLGGFKRPGRMYPGPKSDKFYMPMPGHPNAGPKGQRVDKQGSAAPASTIGSRRGATFAAARQKMSDIKAEVRKKSAESLKREQDQPQNLNRPALNKGPAAPGNKLPAGVGPAAAGQNKLPAGVRDKVASLNKKRKTY